MKECCNNCVYKYDLVRFDHSNGGCEHTDIEGYTCVLFKGFKRDRKVIWVVGEDPEYARCKMFEERNI